MTDLLKDLLEDEPEGWLVAWVMAGATVTIRDESEDEPSPPCTMATGGTPRPR